MKLTCKEETSIHRGFCYSRLISFYLLSELSVCLHVKDTSWVFVCMCYSMICVCHSASCTYVTQSRFLYMVIFDICLTGARGIACSTAHLGRCVCVCVSLSSSLWSCTNPVKLSENDSFIIFYESGTNWNKSLYHSECKYEKLRKYKH